MGDYSQLAGGKLPEGDLVELGEPRRTGRGLCIGAVLAIGFVVATFSVAGQRLDVTFRGGTDPALRATALSGGDADEHGCHASAGYKWCEAESSCIRPWEQGAHTEGDFATRCSLRCNCPPSEAVWECSREQYDAIRNGNGCPLYHPKSSLAKTPKLCNCPPSDAVWECSQEQYDAIRSGSDCPFYHPKSSLAKTLPLCNCPPSEVVWECSREQYDAIRSGSDCPFYHPKSSHAKTLPLCNCPPSEAVWECSQDQYDAIQNGSGCPFYLPNSSSAASDPRTPHLG